jgi:DNA modification methylase
MVTDPPYGVEYDPQWRVDAAAKGNLSYGASAVGKVQNDDRVDWGEAYQLFGAQVAYVWHAGKYSPEVAKSLNDSGFEIISQIIWVKPTFAISRGDYHWQHEPCWYAHRKGATHNWQGSRSETTTWEIERGCATKTGHGTEKPVECMAKPIRNNTKPGQLVCDPFLGSGTTLVACEQLSREGVGIEIDPKYVAVTLERLSEMGLEPKLVTV